MSILCGYNDKTDEMFKVGQEIPVWGCEFLLDSVVNTGISRPDTGRAGESLFVSVDKHIMRGKKNFMHMFAKIIIHLSKKWCF